MDLKKLQRAAAKVEAIKKLDTEITEIDRLALLIANGAVEVSFELKVDDLTDKAKKESNEAAKSVDTMGIFNALSFYTPWLSSQTKEKPSHQHSLATTLSESHALQMLGVLLADKHYKRNALIAQLVEMGVKI